MRKCLGQGATKQVSKVRQKPALSRLRPALEMLEDRRMLAIVAWDGGGDGTSWDQAINWDGDVLPGIDDDVLIDVADQDVTVRIDSADSWKNSTPTDTEWAIRSSACWASICAEPARHSKRSL